MQYLYLAIAIVAEVIATSFMRQSDGFTKLGPSLITAAGYAIAFYFLSLTLRTLPVGIAYAIWSGVGIVLIAGIAWALQGQKLDLPAIAGMALIISGVLVMNLFSSSVAH
ncbi:SMR family transporter [Sphingomonas sp. G-3-2-10]|uniref:DMT family transporter n=1 Tax=Sphingomonas sp. G-3-2-10 TaxID=2728838 RepID=UPI00146B094D|nr:SMR family transporter [Sphingomonas sp. G-3-2-10]NML06512.1 QacE family quaternary ammonium compound efflux SMR transporter [Sphingomonas sp. G-3-2-10]